MPSTTATPLPIAINEEDKENDYSLLVNQEDADEKDATYWMKLMLKCQAYSSFKCSANPEEKKSNPSQELERKTSRKGKKKTNTRRQRKATEKKRETCSEDVSKIKRTKTSLPKAEDKDLELTKESSPAQVQSNQDLLLLETPVCSVDTSINEGDEIRSMCNDVFMELIPDSINFDLPSPVVQPQKTVKEAFDTFIQPVGSTIAPPSEYYQSLLESYQGTLKQLQRMLERQQTSFYEYEHLFKLYSGEQ
jgi:hypothetical protein